MRHRAEQPVEQVEDVGAEVDEETAAGHLRIGPPSLMSVAGTPLVADGHRAQLTDAATVEEFLDRDEAGHGTAVVGDEQVDTGVVAGRDHVLALPRRASHRLLDVDGLAGLGDPDRVVAVRVGRGGDVDGVDLCVVDQRVGIVVPPRDAVPSRVVSGQLAGTAHHGHQLRSFGLLERWPALALGHVADADDAPPHPLHDRSVVEWPGREPWLRRRTQRLRCGG
jgi:hypothetical protein